MAKKIKRKIIGYSLTIIMLLFIAFCILIRFSFFQTYLTQQVIKILSDQIGREVKIEKVNFTFYTTLQIDKIYIADNNKDTLLYINQAEASFGPLSFFNKKLDIKNLVIDDIVLYVSKDKAGLMNLAAKNKGSVVSVKTKVKDNRQPWQIAFHKLEINKLHVKYDDNFTNGHLDVQLPKGIVEVKSLDITNKKIIIDKADLKDALITYDRGVFNIVDSSSHNMHFLGDTKLFYNDLNIANAHFVYDDHRKKNDTLGMDFFHLNVKDINIHIASGRIDHDTIFGEVKQMNCSEKCGFVIKDMIANARVSTSDIELKNLKLITGNSLVQNYLQFNYDSFPDFKKFITNVQIDANLIKSDISLRDINYFAKGALSKIAHNQLWISGHIHGTINNLKGNDIELETGLNTLFKGKFEMQGLPRFKETFISANIEHAVSNMSDIRRIYPSLVLPEMLNKLGTVTYSGNFDGFPTDFVADGNFNTEIGRLDADLNLKLPPDGVPVYSGHLISSSFDIGKLFNQEKNLGTISMDANIKGSGLNLNTLNTTFDGKVNEIQIKGYDYKDAVIDGTFKKKLFSGNLKVKDENLDLVFNGSVNLDSTLPVFNFVADIKKADLQALHLYNKKVVISTYSSIHFLGKKLDNFNGGIDLSDLVIKTDSGTVPISHLLINSTTDQNGLKKLNLESSILNASINGKFNYSQLPKIIQAYYKHYSIAPQYINLDTVGFAKFDFNAVIFEPGPLSKLISNKFNLIRNSTVDGNFNSLQNELTLTATIPELIIGNLKFKNIEVDANSTTNTFDIDAKLRGLFNKDSLLVKNTFFKAHLRPDHYFDFELTSANFDSSYRADLQGLVGTDFKSIYAQLDNSFLLINNKRWDFLAKNSIQYSKKYLQTTNLVLKQEEKEIYITTTHPRDSTTTLEIDLSNISVNDFSKIFDKSKNNYFGKADGGLEIHDIFNKPTYFSNVYVANLGVNKDTVGNLTVSMEVEDFSKKIPVDVKLKGKYNDIEATGSYTPGKIENAIDINININRFKVDVINNYLYQYVTQASGYALGQIKISGTDKKPQLTGFINLKKCEATVAYINTHYRLENEIVKFKENEIRFDNILLQDDNKSTAIAAGSIRHTNLKNFFFDIAVTTDYFQMLRTTQKENPIYWGTINVTNATALFQGPLKNISIKVSGTTAKNSTLTIPVRTTAETDNYSFFKFVNKSDTVVVKGPKPKIKSLVDVSIDLDVTETAEMTLILDPASGDRITAHGNGNIRVAYNDIGGLKVQGDYTIASGNYFFTLQNIINKYFTIDKGSRITFDGNIYEAMLDVSAVYAVRTAPNDLIIDRIIEDEALKTLATKRVPTKLILLLKGPMQQPIIDFDIKIENVDPRLQSFVDTKIADLRNDKNELNKQAASLLVMNSFYPAGLGTGALISGGATSTFSELLSTQISNLVSRFIGNFLEGFDIRIEYKPYSQDGVSGNDIYIGVRQGILGQRLVLNAGGNINLTNKATAKNQNQYNLDFSAEYQVTKDGRFKLKAYNKTSVGATSTDPYLGSGNSNSTGIGVSYREEFDDFKDLKEQWRQRREKRREKKQNKVPGHTPPTAIINKEETEIQNQ